MEFPAFTAGIIPGGLTDTFEVQVLVCYLLRHTLQKPTFAQLGDIVQADALVNYFAYAEAVSQLKQSGHLETVSLEEEEVLSLTHLGMEMADIFASSLPYTVREKALRTARAALQAREQETEQNTAILEKLTEEKGYALTLTIADGDTEFLSVSLFAPEQEQGEEMRRRFLQNPAAFYQGVLSLLTD